MELEAPAVGAAGPGFGQWCVEASWVTGQDPEDMGAWRRGACVPWSSQRDGWQEGGQGPRVRSRGSPSLSRGYVLPEPSRPLHPA